MNAPLLPESCMKINENMKAPDSCKIQVPSEKRGMVF